MSQNEEMYTACVCVAGTLTQTSLAFPARKTTPSLAGGMCVSGATFMATFKNNIACAAAGNEKTTDESDEGLLVIRNF